MSSEKSPRHLAAIDLAEQGIPVFPCIVGGKQPATPNGFHDATTDLDQIDAWWQEADYNVALEPEAAGWGVVDVDGPEGRQNWETLSAQHGLGRTTEVQTPRGGSHYYFSGSLPSSASKLAPHVDTRGRGGYVLVPPSVVDRRSYEWASTEEFLDIPDWIQDALVVSNTKMEAAIDELDAPANIARARVYLEKAAPAIEGSGGNNRTYQIACTVLNLGLSPECALDLIDEIWNPSCVPPWPRDELSEIVAHAGQYAQNEAGAWGVVSGEEAFKDLEPPPQAPTQRSRFYAYNDEEQDHMPAPRWLIPELLPDESTVLFYGPSRSYKSFLALDIGLALASQTETFGHTRSESCEVVYCAGEGPRGIGGGRKSAWKLARGVSRPIPFYLIHNVPSISRTEQVYELIDQITNQGLKPKVVIIDTLRRAMSGLSENDARDTGQFIDAIELIKRTFKCTVIVIHHSGHEGNHPRGSSAIFADFDAVVEFAAVQKTKAVSVRVRKQKDAEEREAPWTFEGKQVGPSLVFFPVDRDEFRKITAEEDAFDPHRVGAALQSLNAYGEEAAVTTNVLAEHLTPMIGGQNQEDRLQAVQRTRRALGRLAHKSLRGYCAGSGHSLRWFLLAPTNPSAQTPL